MADNLAAGRFNWVLVSVMLITLNRPARACDCMNSPGSPRLVPTSTTADKRPFFAPVNTHVWLLGDRVEFADIDVIDPNGSSIEVEPAFETNWNVPSETSGGISTIEWVPKQLRPWTRYRVHFHRELVGDFTTGDSVDSRPPSAVDSIDLAITQGNFATSCDYGSPYGSLHLRGGAATQTPAECLLYRIRAAAHTPGNFKNFESLLLSHCDRDSQRAVDLSAGRENCQMRNFLFPGPLQPATLSVSTVDLAGNTSTPISVEWIGPHTAVSLELAQRLASGGQSSLSLHQTFCARPNTAAPTPCGAPRRWLVLLVGAAAFAVGVGGTWTLRKPRTCSTPVARR